MFVRRLSAGKNTSTRNCGLPNEKCVRGELEHNPSVHGLRFIGANILCICEEKMGRQKEQYHGRNILSCVPNNAILKGSEIKSWIAWHIEHENSKRKIALQMQEYLETMNDDHSYQLYRTNDRKSRNVRYAAMLVSEY